MNDREILSYLKSKPNVTIVDRRKKIVLVTVNRTSVYFTFYKSMVPFGFRVVFDSGVNLTRISGFLSAIASRLSVNDGRILVQEAWLRLKRKKVVMIPNSWLRFDSMELFFRDQWLYGKKEFWDALHDSIVEMLSVKNDHHDEGSRAWRTYMDLIEKYF